jgi:hypothetical protein
MGIDTFLVIPIDEPQLFDGYGTFDPWPLVYLEDARLRIHYSGLAGVDTVLKIADANQNYRQKNLDPMRSLQIPKPFSLDRWLKALGRLTVGLLGWFCVAFHAHKHTSGFLVILALMLMYFWQLSVSRLAIFLAPAQKAPRLKTECLFG